MNTQQLLCFVCVADRLNFTKAAEELFLSPPTVTHHIQTLEAEVKEKDEKLRANEITIRKLENEIYNLKKQNMRMIAAGGDKAYQAKF